MPTLTVVAIVTCDPKFLVACEHELSSYCKTVSYYIDQNKTNDIDQTLKRTLSEIIGLTDGNIRTEVVVMDATIKNKSGSYFIVDTLFEEFPHPAGTALSMLVGAGIPVIVNQNTKDPSLAWKVGVLGGQLFVKGQLHSLIQSQMQSLKFNRHTLEVENEFAHVYDSAELAGAATVSAIIWENEYVSRYVGEHVHSASNPVRILDLGCGTGRFEEILLANETISPKIESITAIDFAPMYLIKAQERLPQFLKDTSVRKIHFARRIAEDLRWPPDHFDIVIAGFGITCFSRFHLTLPEMYRVLKPGGLALMNGYNRSAITFDFETLMTERVGQPASHFAIRIDRDENVMYLGNSTIQCFTFNVDDLEVILKLVGFKPIKNSAITFPTLYGSARKEYLKKLSSYSAVPSQTARRSTRKRAASYQRRKLVSDQRESGFNELLHMMDMDLAMVLNDRGFYFCMAMHK